MRTLQSHRGPSASALQAPAPARASRPGRAWATEVARRRFAPARSMLRLACLRGTRQGGKSTGTCRPAVLFRAVPAWPPACPAGTHGSRPRQAIRAPSGFGPGSGRGSTRNRHAAQWTPGAAPAARNPCPSRAAGCGQSTTPETSRCARASIAVDSGRLLQAGCCQPIALTDSQGRPAPFRVG